MPGRDCLKLLNQSPTRIHIRRKKHSDRNCRIRIDHSQLSLSCLYSFKVAVNLDAPANAYAGSQGTPAIDDDGRTAIYDITARTVYLPSGRRLEAHSGFGAMMDNPRHIHVRMKGATPPNVYTLTLRERLFHGVRAIRLNPINDSRMYGRAGILAHTYMLGANGQSNGCVSFNDYDEFLNAYLRGEITRLAVVERLDSPPGRLYAGQLPGAVKDLLRSTDHNRQYAAAGDH